ncbi:zinc ribbon domain-containing protein [Coraliomargarita sinensis]|uniref:Zinc ribbon domain-containing protein n=1 Tax=Coraliomargarita sinensis TaxID=2174842 RepID=A0A317ZLU4_9BACT|nr:zinc-ribbon domain-containing protein [Coraliomargarita sinensis]PXA04789.1 zinc ribbon domain-containing protein [Coraliomargarita sinensis]
MHSIKPGRGPSMAGGIGGLAAAGFGVLWMVAASSMGAPPIFVGFGVIFILAALGSAAYNFYNATSKNRFSHFDITGPGEEVDPLERRHRDAPRDPVEGGKKPAFCSDCGTKMEPNYEYCPNCGKDI